MNNFRKIHSLMVLKFSNVFFQRFHFGGSSFRLTRNLRERHRDLLYTPCIHACIPVSLSTLFNRMVLLFIYFFLPKMNLRSPITITHHPQSTLEFIFGVVHSTGLDKWMMTYTNHFNIIQSIFTDLKILGALLIHTSSAPTPNPDNHCSFYCLHGFAFFRMLYSWNHAVCRLYRLTSTVSNMHLNFFHVFSWLDSSFLSQH